MSRLFLVVLVSTLALVLGGCDPGNDSEAGGTGMDDFAALRDRVMADAKKQLPELATTLDAKIDTAEGTSEQRVAPTTGSGTYAYGVESWMKGPAPANGALAGAVESLGYTDLSEKTNQVTGTSPDGEVTLTVTHRTLSGEPPVFIVTISSTDEVRLSKDEIAQARSDDLIGSTDDLGLGSTQG